MNDVLEPLESGLLTVSKIHKIHYATYGNPKGIPLLCFHGGPGGGFKDKYIALTDMDKYYTIVFDQRGCGASIPVAEIIENTCMDTVNDALKLLKYLHVKKCVVMGFSYGTTLAFAFAIKHPNKIIKMFLSSIFIPLNFNDWFFGGGAGKVLSKAYKNFVSVIKNTDPIELLKEYDSAIIDRKKEIAAALVNWESELFKGLKTVTLCSVNDISNKILANKRVFLHYVAHDMFGIGLWIMQNIYKIKYIPIFIVHGKLDLIIPVSTVYKILEILPNVTLKMMDQEGHVGNAITTQIYSCMNADILP